MAAVLLGIAVSPLPPESASTLPIYAFPPAPLVRARCPSSQIRPSSMPLLASRRRSSAGARSAGSGFDFEGNGVEEEEGEGEEKGGESAGGEVDWEGEMKKRLSELEEMRELERKAEDLQSQLKEGETGGGEEGEGEETEEEKRDRVRRELEKLAKEQAERRKTARLMFELGKKAYGKGMYGRAVEFLEGALTIIPKPTLFGGEIQIWLAMAYEANNRHKDCIVLYQQLEKHHPFVSIRRQASELRYILQAPKLKITKDEMVSIPLIGSNYDTYAGTWSDKYKDRDWLKKTTTSPSSSSENYWGDFLPWRSMAGWEKNQAFWVAVALWLGVVGIVLLLQS